MSKLAHSNEIWKAWTCSHILLIIPTYTIKDDVISAVWYCTWSHHNVLNFWIFWADKYLQKAHCFLIFYLVHFVPLHPTWQNLCILAKQVLLIISLSLVPRTSPTYYGLNCMQFLNALRNSSGSKQILNCTSHDHPQVCTTIETHMLYISNHSEGANMYVHPSSLPIMLCHQWICVGNL